MREILFKAKRLDNGEWVEGCYAFARKLLCKENVHAIFTGEGFNWYYKIDPSTLCQYTGLTDKNRKKIFEGDIIIYDTKYFIDGQRFDKGVVLWDSGRCCFVRTSDEDKNKQFEIRRWLRSDYEVIGNIHDKENQDE